MLILSTGNMEEWVSINTLDNKHARTVLSGAGPQTIGSPIDELQ